VEGAQRLMRGRVALACALLLAGAAGAALPAAAQASRSQLSVMEDDHLVLYSGPAVRERALDQMQRLGVTTLHVLVIWRRLAPATRPADATDPASYGGWDPYDELVQSAQARGIGVLMTPTAPMPDWASECGPRVARRWICKPRASDFRAFVQALGTRYSGLYSPFGSPLPRVSMWSIWNEPNHSSWLRPQSSAPARYRALATAGLSALSATGHGGDLRLLGETAPGGGTKATAPVEFMRDVFCIPCSRRPHFAIDGISDHPYTYGAMAAPSAFHGSAGDAPIGAVDHLVKLVDNAAHYGIVPRRLPVYLTEFGFQTRPPDPYGVSLSQQARYLNYSDWIAFRNPRIASVAQYELNDDPRVAVFNTGLRFAGGRPKPALAAYAMPIYVQRLGDGSARVFGLVRAARGTGATVAIQNRRRGDFHTVAHVSTNRWGYLLARVRDYRGRWRLVARAGGGLTLTSREALASPA
jgi:hypothetical protein